MTTFPESAAARYSPPLSVAARSFTAFDLTPDLALARSAPRRK